MGLLCIPGNYFEFQSNFINFNDNNGFFRIYFALRADEFLRRNGNTSLLAAIPLVGADLIFLL
jgi:hypothetical protein